MEEFGSQRYDLRKVQLVLCSLQCCQMPLILNLSVVDRPPVSMWFSVLQLEVIIRSDGPRLSSLPSAS